MDPVQVIADSPLMRSIERSSLDGLRTGLESIVLDEQALVLLDGTGGGALYFVASGRLEVIQAATDQAGMARDARLLATLVPGDVVSEMRSLIGNAGSAALRAVTEARLVKLTKERFDYFIALHPDVTRKLRSIFSPRFYHNELVRVLRSMFGDLGEDLLADIEQRLTWRHVVRGDALVRPGEPSTGLLVVVSGRVRELTEAGAEGARIVNEAAQGQVVGAMGVFTDEMQTTTAVAARDSVLLEFSREGFQELALRYPKLNEWLARLLSTWLHGAMRETPPDLLCTNILLVPANAAAPLADFARRLCEALSRHARSRRTKFQITLILLHPPGTARPHGTLRWLQERGVDRHFHLHDGDGGELDRIVRYVTRREFGLVLSGGGSRGFAHVGAIRAMREAGLPIDMIAGVSMGAIIAAAFAISDDFEATVQSLKERFKTAFGDYTLPFVSLTRGRRFDDMLKAVFGDANIEDL